MPPQNPQYTLRDSNGNVLGAIYADSNDEIALHHAGSSSETTIGSSGVQTQGVDTESLDVAGWEWVDVTSHGADNTGASDVSAAIDSLIGDNTVLVFPPGTYHFDNGVFAEGIENIAIRAEGDVTITVSDTIGEGVFNFGTPAAPCDNVHVSGLSYDFTAAGNGDMPLRIVAQNRFEVADIDVTGEISNYGSTADGVMRTAGRFAIRADDGIGRVRRYRVPDGGADTTDIDGVRLHGVVVAGGQSTGGHITFEDCHIGHFHDNGLYCSSTDTRITVRGGIIENNDISAIRLHGDGRAEDVRFVIDDAAGTTQSRCFWVREHGHRRLENCSFFMNETSTGECIRTGSDASGSLHVSNIDANTADQTFFRSDGDVHATVEKCNVEGIGDTNNGGVVVLAGETHIKDSVFDWGEDTWTNARPGIRFDTADCSVENTTIVCPRYPVWVRAGGAGSLISNGSFDSQDPSFEGIRIEEADITVENSEYGSLRQDVRTVVDGWGTNSGDPSVEGEWNGNGKEGVMVRDTTNLTNHVYINGSWEEL